MKIKPILTCFVIFALVTVGSVPAAAPSSEQLITQRIIVRGWEIIRIREGPNLVDIRCEPMIDSVEQLQAYKTARLDLLHNVSTTMNPEDKVGAGVTLNYPLAYSEVAALVATYEFNLRYYEYIGNRGNQGGIPVLTEYSLTDWEEQLKQVLGPEFRIIGITMIQGSIPVKRLLELQNDPVVFLVDIGPPEFYEERSKGKHVVQAIPNLYYYLTKSLPPTTTLPPATTLYQTFFVSPTTTPPLLPSVPPSTPLTTTFSTPICTIPCPPSMPPTVPPATTPYTILTTTFSTPICTIPCPPYTTPPPVPTTSDKNEEENHAPSVTLTSPSGGEVLQGEVTIIWEATDPDNDPLRFTLSYWNGSEWVLLDSELQAPNYLWDTTTVPDGQTYQLRVVVSDGTQTEVDSSDAAFTILNAPQPKVQVEEFYYDSILVVFGLMVSIIGLLLLRLRIRRCPCK